MLEKKSSALSMANIQAVQASIDAIDNAIKKTEIERNKSKLAAKMRINLKDKLELFARK